MIYRRCECNEFAKKNDRRITDDLAKKKILTFLIELIPLPLFVIMSSSK